MTARRPVTSSEQNTTCSCGPGCPLPGANTAVMPPTLCRSAIPDARMPTVSVPAYLASLRVFSPLATFPPAERGRWERYIAAERAPDRATLVAIEHDTGLA